MAIAFFRQNLNNSLLERQSDQPGQKPLGRVPLGQVRLSDSIVSLLHYKQQYIIACLANGRCELIPRIDDQVFYPGFSDM